MRMWDIAYKLLKSNKTQSVLKDVLNLLRCSFVKHPKNVQYKNACFAELFSFIQYLQINYNPNTFKVYSHSQFFHAENVNFIPEKEKLLIHCQKLKIFSFFAKVPQNIFFLNRQLLTQTVVFLQTFLSLIST